VFGKPEPLMSLGEETSTLNGGRTLFTPHNIEEETMKITRLFFIIPMLISLSTPIFAQTLPATNTIEIISPDTNEVIDGRGFTVVVKGTLIPAHHHFLNLVVFYNQEAHFASVELDSTSGTVLSIGVSSPILEVLKPRTGRSVNDKFVFVVDVVGIMDLQNVNIHVSLMDTTEFDVVGQSASVITRDNGTGCTGGPGCPPAGSP